jgi:hypothetical protein
MRKSGLTGVALASLLWAASALAAPGTVLRDDKLYAQPSSTAKVVGSASRGAAVDIVAKQGGWLRVKVGKSEGWIRLLSVRSGSGGVGGVGVGDVVGAATTKSDPTRVVAVAGLRGLSEQDLKQAEFNGAELARMEKFANSAEQAKTRASRVGLAATSISPLPAPRPPASQSNSGWGEGY